MTECKIMSHSYRYMVYIFVFLQSYTSYIQYIFIIFIKSIKSFICCSKCKLVYLKQEYIYNQMIQLLYIYIQHIRLKSMRFIHNYNYLSLYIHVNIFQWVHIELQVIQEHIYIYNLLFVQICTIVRHCIYRYIYVKLQNKHMRIIL